MIDIFITGTGIEIQKAITCLKQDYRIGCIKELPPASRGKHRCYISAAHNNQCKICRNFHADESIEVCPECLAALEDD